MEIVKEEDGMKKKIFAGTILMLCSTLTIAGCNATPSKKGEFDSREYILSIDDTHDFMKSLKLNAGNKGSVEIETSSDILEETEDGVFRAKASGSALIEAKMNGQVIASCKVVVKYKLASPKNFIFSQETGTLTWDKAFLSLDGEDVYANTYVLSYAQNMRDGSLGEWKSESLNNNEYTFGSEGSYKVKICAGVSGDRAKYIDNAFSQEFNVNYGSVGGITNLTLTNSSNYDEEKVTLSWEGIANAKYDIWLNGYLRAEDLESPEYLLDYSESGICVKEGGQINVKIVVKDRDGLSENSEFTKTISRLARPQLSYVNSDKSNGNILVSSSEGEVVYVVRDEDGKVLSQSTSLSQTLEGYQEGIYKIQVYARGEGEIPSSPTSIIKFAKLSTPSVSVDVTKDVVKITFQSARYVRRYKLSLNGKDSVITLGEGESEYSLNLSEYNLSAGDYDIKVTALPTLDNGEIKEFTFEGEKTSNILNSDQGSCTFKVLAEFSEVSHYIEGETSVFKFDKIEGTTDYIVKLNGDVLSQSKFEVDNSGDKTRILIDGLKNFTPNANGEYEFTFTAQRKEGGRYTGVESSTTKSLKILGVVSASSNQTNGAFAFNKVANSDTYYYEIYRTGDDYILKYGQTPIHTNTLYSGNKTTETLTGGYYKIKIWTLSNDENYYLDSNFVDNSKYFEGNFSVTQTLDAPDVEYDKASNTLKIERVEFGGGYEIYINNVLKGKLDLANDEDEAVYTFGDNDFINPSTYSISVKATGGTKYGSEIYSPSQASTISIKRLATPTISVKEDFDTFGKKTGETLTVTKVNDVKSVQYYINGKKLDDEGYSISFYDPTLGNNFTLGVKYIAKEEGLKTYYLDSVLYEEEFVRIDAPTNIEYNGGKVTFTGSDKATDYYVTLYLENANGTKNYVGLKLNSTQTTIDLQQKISALLSTNPWMSSIYENAKSYEIQLYSVINSKIDGKYYLPSLNGTSISGGEGLEINKLSATTLSFDKETKLLSWTEVEGGSTYDVYANGSVIATNLSSLSISLDSEALKSLNLLQGVTFKVKSNNPRYLDSQQSNEIFVKKLASASGVSVSRDGGVTIIIPDSANTQKVLNGTEEMTLSAEKTSATITLSGNETLKIIFVGRDEGNKYYFDSDVAQFTFKEFGDISMTQDGDILSWNNPAVGQSGVQNDRTIYTLIINNNGSTINYQTIQRSLNLSEIQNLTSATFNKGDIQFKVKASLSEGYTLSQGGVGYYGESESEAISITKFSQVEGTSRVVDSENGNAFTKKNSPYVIFEFEDKWTDDVEFVITNTFADGNTFTQTQQSSVTLKVGEKTVYFTSFTHESGKYILTVAGEYFSNAGRYKLNFVVKKAGYIQSDEYGIEICRLKQISSLSVTDKGIITLSDTNNYDGDIPAYNCNPNYLIMLTIGGKTEVKNIAKDSEMDISSFTIWGDNYGAYSLQAICYDEGGKVLPSNAQVTISGTKLESVKDLTVTDEGVLTLTSNETEDVIFSARIDGVEKTLPLENTENKFSMPLLEIAELFELTVDKTYEIEVTVRKKGSVDADYKSVSFALAHQDTYYLVKDERGVNTYLVIEKKDDDSSCGFRLNTEKGIINLSTTGFAYIMPIIQGYVHYDLEGNNMTNMTFSQSSGDDSFLCYAMELDSLMNSIGSLLGGDGYGDYSFKISRIGKEDSVVTQNNEQTIEFVKLNQIQTDKNANDYIKIQDGVLRFGFTNSTSKKDAVVSYLIDFAYNDGNNHTQYITSNKSLDLRDIGLIAGVEYTIQIKVICGESDIIASDYAGGVTTMQYTTPQILEIDGGALKFSKQSFKDSEFGQKVLAFTKGEISEQDLIDYISSQTLTNPFYSSFSNDAFNLDKAVGEIKFVKLNNGNITGQEQTITLNLIDLIPDFTFDSVTLGGGEITSFYGLVAYLKDSNVADKTDKVQSLLKKLASSNKGVGLNKILFDDIGREISTGDYRVSVRQKGGDGFIDSAFSSAKDISINPALAIELIHDEENNRYEALLSPQNTQTNFILQIRQDVKSSSPIIYPQIHIAKNGNDNWIAGCEGEDISEILGEYSGGFAIILNDIRKILQDKGIAILPSEKELVCDVFVNDENSLSKSSKFTLCYRELNGSDITFQNGKLNLGRGYLTNKVLLRYQQKGLNESEKIFNGSVDLPELGAYNYFIISFPGEIISNNVYIESARFMVKNAYKLSSPIVTTADNIFNIKLANNDISKKDEISLKISNNRSSGLSNDINGLGEISNLATNGISYQAGAFTGEQNAEQFIFKLGGNSVALTVESSEESESEKAEYILSHEGVLVFSSQEKTYRAKMLSSVDLSIKDGNVVWNACGDDITGDILYEVKIEYYSTSDSDTDETDKVAQTLYTASTMIDTNNFLDTLTDYDYKSYKVSVTTLVGEKLAGSGDVRTIEGDYYNLQSSSSFATGEVVLRGNESSKKLTRASIVTNASVTNGNIVFKTTEDDFMIMASRSGKSFLLKGDIAKNENTKEVTFTPKTGEENGGLEEGYEYDLTIYTYDATSENAGGGILLSKPVEIESVYKLPEITEDRYAITFDNTTYLDFTSYFNNGVAGDNSCYKLVIKYTEANGSETHKLLDSSSRKVDISGWKALEMYAIADVNTSKKLINSTSVSLNISETSIRKNDYLLSVSFDTAMQRFNWNWTDNREGEFEYYVELVYADGSVESAFVNDLFYAPSNMGKVSTFKISARQLPDEVEGVYTIYTFSGTYSVNGSYELNMFAGGNGSETNPYIISDKDMFKNMANRNESSQKVYFKIADSLKELSFTQSELKSGNEYLFKTFYGVLDGNGLQITLTCDEMLSTSDHTLTIGASSGKYTFSYACGLFEKIGENGGVKNLNIKMVLSMTNIPGPSLVCPVAVVNEGRIEGVTIQGYSMETISNTSYDIFIGGIAGVNKKDIFSCKNALALDLTIKQTSFGMAGIVLVNEGNVQKCMVSGTKSVTLSNSSSSTHIGGIALTNLNKGKINLCGVDSDFKVSMKSSSNTYAGGIVEVNVAGGISASYFNGTFALGSTYGNLNSGGVAYCFNGGTVKYVVCTNTVFGSNIKSSPTVTGCYGNGGVNGLISLTPKDNILTSGYDGCTLKIIEYSGKYTAKLVY